VRGKKIWKRCSSYNSTYLKSGDSVKVVLCIYKGTSIHGWSEDTENKSVNIRPLFGG